MLGSGIRVIMFCFSQLNVLIGHPRDLPHFPSQIPNFVVTEELTPGLHPVLPLFAFYTALKDQPVGAWAILDSDPEAVGHLCAWGFAEAKNVVFGSLAEQALDDIKDVVTACQNHCKPAVLPEPTIALMRLQMPVNVELQGEEGWLPPPAQSPAHAPPGGPSEAPEPELPAIQSEQEEAQQAQRSAPSVPHKQAPPATSSTSSSLWAAAGKTPTQSPPKPKASKRAHPTEPTASKKPKKEAPKATTKFVNRPKPTNQPFIAPKQSSPTQDSAVEVARRLHAARAGQPAERKLRVHLIH